MNLQIPIEIVKLAVKAGFKNKIFGSNLDTSWGTVSLDSKFLDAQDRKILMDIASKPVPKAKNGEEPDPAGIKTLKNKIKILNKLADASVGDKTFKNLNTLAEAIKTFFEKVPRHWFFHAEHRDEMLVPYVITECKYESSCRGSLPHVTIKGEYYLRGEQKEKNFTIYRTNLVGAGKTVLAVLAERGITPASDELIRDYLAELEQYKKFQPQTGEQFVAQSFGVKGFKDIENDEDSRDYWHSQKEISLEKSGEKSRVVMDDEQFKEKSESQATESLLFAKVHESDDYDDDETPADEDLSKEERDEQNKVNVMLPIHPRLVVFDLKKHTHCEVHASNLEPYVYDASLSEKLVLPVERKSLIDVLLASAQSVQQDIIKGKSGGTIILCSGAPGTGKTLTAEVYSEIANRPLYVVQCSQLGIDSGDLEKHLSVVLDRSTRWNAVLLIDEADVYIRERGGDLNQNAVVGVFLRLLEYYSGVLFLTTNRATIIDDAIVSRVMAHVRYSVPKTQAEKIRLWEVLSKQYQVSLNDSLVNSLIKEFPEISGRSIKQMLKLAKVLTQTGSRKLDLELFKWLTQFQDIEKPE